MIERADNRATRPNGLAAPPPQSYIGLAELSSRLGVCGRTVRTWVAERSLPAYRIGRKLLFDWGAVEQWLANYRVAPTTVDTVADEILADVLAAL